MGVTAVAGGWVEDRTGQQNADEPTGRIKPCRPEKDAGPGAPGLRRVPVCLPLVAEIHRPDGGAVTGPWGAGSMEEEGAAEKMLLWARGCPVTAVW